LAPLIGRRLAVISDARLSSRTDQASIAERLLSVSGEDSITIDRKFRDAWTGRLDTRFMILTNELPALGDASGALASRFILLKLEHSFFGHEDTKLESRLYAELPGILNWSLDGLDRLNERGHFVQPASSAEMMQDLEDLGSPIKAFVREKCEVVTGAETPTKRVFSTYQDWCNEHGRDRPGTEQIFGRNLKAALPSIKTVNRREGMDRWRAYVGLKLS
jgi:putative DNA primase/helicase